jgi:hypothetical protein
MLAFGFQFDAPALRLLAYHSPFGSECRLALFYRAAGRRGTAAEPPRCSR